ncbi:MAG: efflux RND transporter permease subunit, partial [bacterium]|nr:efflux RND transporter permease subunit [bacterium]
MNKKKVTITEHAINRPVTTMMIFLCFIVVGTIASRLLPLEFFPDADEPFINVEIPYPDSTPEEVEQQITRPVEEVLATISGIKRMRSDSRENSANIFVEFKWGTNTEIKAIEAREKIDSIRDQLPPDVERIRIGKFSTSDMVLLQLRISSKRDLSNAYDMLNRRVKRRLERIRGVSRVTLYGVDKKEVRIQLSANRITAHRVDLNHLARVLRTANFLVTAGKITDGNRRFTVRPMGEIKKPSQIEDLIVGDNNLKLKDIAKITFEQPEPLYGRHLNRKYAIGVDLYKETGANLVEVGTEVKEEIEKIKQDPKLEGVDIYFMDDMAEGVVSSLDELMKSGLIGGLLAIVVLFFFLRHWFSTFIVALSVPFSLLVTLAFMYFLGLSMNILSMLGLLVAVGMLVDNAVVVTENIYRHQKDVAPGGNGGIIGAVNEVSLAITAGTLTTAIVFLPNIVASSNIITFYLKYVSLSFCIALAASLVIAKTVVPLLATKVKASPLSRINKKKTVIDRAASRYERTLDWLLRHRKTSVAIILVCLFGVIIPASVVKNDMFPEQRDRRLRLFFKINDTYTLEKVETVVDKVEEYLFANKEKFEIESVYTFYQSNFASSTIILTRGDKASKSQEQIQDEIREKLPLLAMAAPSFERRSSAGTNEALRIQVIGPSTERLTVLSHQVADVLEKVPGFKTVRSDAVVGKKEVLVTVNRERAKKQGFSPRQVADSISVAIRGVNLRPIQDEGGETRVRVEFREEDKQTREQLRDLVLFSRGNEPVKLAAVADFKVRQGPSGIRRENRTTTMGVSIDLKDLTVNEAKDKISDALKDFNFPAGYSWNYGRSFNFEDETMKLMMINTLLALALIYFVMASLFESLMLPGAVWVSIIFAIIGVWWFFMFTGTTFTFMSWVGVLVLIGVVVNNGIVLIDYINQLRQRGVSRHEAIVQAGHHRLRPILMTAGTTIFSLIPLCFSTTQIGGGGPPYFPMARAIVGGLAFSTLVTLFILPT